MSSFKMRELIKSLAVGILGVLFVALVIWLVSSFVILQTILQATVISIGIVVFLVSFGAFIRVCFFG